LIVWLNLGSRIDAEAGAQGEIVAGAVRSGEVLGRAAAANENSVVLLEGILHYRGGRVGFIESIVGNEVGACREKGDKE
jgi:hypothetical protein